MNAQEMRKVAAVRITDDFPAKGELVRLYTSRRFPIEASSSMNFF